jgi:hypothetical protein
MSSALLDAGNLDALVGTGMPAFQRASPAEHKPTTRTVKAFEGPVSLSSTDNAAEDSLFSTKNSSSSQGNNFKVVVRVRPPIKRETAVNALMCVASEGNETLTVTSGLQDVQALYCLCLCIKCFIYHACVYLFQLKQLDVI